MRLHRSRDDVALDPDGHTARGGGYVARVEDSELAEGALELVRFLGRCRVTPARYGYWPIRIQQGEVWERDDGFGDWVLGADRAVRAHLLQTAVCEEVDSAFEPPRADATAVVAPGALAAPRLTISRYEYMDPQSGWFIGGRAGERLPLHEVVAIQPRLLDYLALEPGWLVNVEPHGAWVKRRG